MVRVGIVGIGNSAEIHAQAFQKNENCELVCVAGTELTRTAIFAKRLRIPEVKTVSQLVQSSDIDAVVFAVPAYYQSELAINAFDSGKHVLCEKPLAVSYAEAVKVAESWRKSSAIGMVNFCYRLIPQIQELMLRLDAGEIGKIQSIYVEWVLSTKLNKALCHNWKDCREYGGGVLQNYGVHVLDYLFHTSKNIQVIGASQEVFNKTLPDKDNIEHLVSADEVTTILLSTDECPSIIIHLSLVSFPPTGHKIIARGNLATLEVNNMNPLTPWGPFSLLKYDVNSNIELTTKGSCENFQNMTSLFEGITDRFLNAIVQNKQIEPSIQDGLIVSKIVHEIEQRTITKTL